MGGEATTLVNDGFEYSGPADALAADIAALAPKPASPPEASPPASPDVPRGTLPEKKADEPAKPTAQETHDRIQKLTWEREEANRRADAAEQRAAAAAKPKEEPRPAAKPDTKAEIARFMAMPGAPVLDDYDDFSQFSAAQALFIADRRFEERQAAVDRARTADTRQQAAQDRHRTFAGRLTEATTARPELKELLATSTAQIDEGPMAYVMTSSPVGIAIMEHFARHPEDAARIAAIPQDMERYAQMRVLEASLTPKKTEEKAAAAPPGSAPLDEKAAQATTKAEPPINPVGSSPVSVKDDDALSDDLDDDEWFRRRDKQQKAERMKGVRR